MEDFLFELAELVLDALRVAVVPRVDRPVLDVLRDGRDLRDDRVVVPVVELRDVLLLDVFDADHELIAFGVLLQEAEDAVQRLQFAVGVAAQREDRRAVVPGPGADDTGVRAFDFHVYVRCES